MGFTEPDSPSSPERFAGVATQPMAPGAGLDTAEIAAACAAAEAVWGGVSNPGGPREQQAKSVMESPPGYGDFDILAGFSGGWPNDAGPPDND